MLDLSEPDTEGLQERDASSSTPTARSCRRKSLDEKLPSVVTDAGGDTLAKETKRKKGTIGSQPRGNHNAFTHIQKKPSLPPSLLSPNCEVCKKTRTTRARKRMKPKKRLDGIALSTNFGHKNARIVQDDFTNWNSGLSDDNKSNIGNNAVKEMSSSVT